MDPDINYPYQYHPYGHIIIPSTRGVRVRELPDLQHILTMSKADSININLMVCSVNSKQVHCGWSGEVRV